MDLAPVEYVVIEFPGNQFRGDIAPAIGELVEQGLVHILDLIFVKKDADGSVTSFEYDDIEAGAAYAEIEGEADGAMSEEDVQLIADDLPPDCSALVVVFEDLWARRLGHAVRAAGGELVAGGRIPHALLTAALGGSNEQNASAEVPA